MSKEQQTMILLVLVINTICNLGLVGKTKKIEADTLYELICVLAYPFLGVAIGTILAYLIKYF